MIRTLKAQYPGPAEVKVVDEPGAGGAHHEYYISRLGVGQDKSIPAPVYVFGHVKFQKGPVKESSINGCFQEDLIAICIDRLECFQAGNYACFENGKALESLKTALHWLNERTRDRKDRGVEGTSTK